MPGVGTTHHIKLAGDYHLVRQGSYSKRPAPLFGARFTTGDPDYNNLSLWQHWAQTCWVGGLDADTWIDDAMYDEAVGVDTSQHEVMMLSRDLARGAGSNWTLGGGQKDRMFASFNGSLYCLNIGAAATLYKYDDGTDGWTLTKTFSENVQTMVGFYGYLFFGTDGANLQKMDTSEVFTTTAKPATVTDQVYAMGVYRQRLYVGFGRNIWRLKPTFAWDGSTSFYQAAGVNYLIAMELHLGFLYIASQDGHILRTDANNTFDLWTMAGGVVTGMRSYDGKLFVAVKEPLPGTTAAQGVLYQFTGAAVTELKRWGTIGNSCSLGRLHVAARKLFYGASNLLGILNGFGIAQYVAEEDAHSLFSTLQGTGTYGRGSGEGDYHQVTHVFFWKGFLFAAVYGHGAFKTRYTWKDASKFVATYDTTAAGANPASKNGGWITSSDFDAGTPGLQKLWNAITVHVDLPNANTSITCEYSTNGGTTWKYVDRLDTAAGATLTGDGVTIRRAKTWKLFEVKASRLKWRLTLRTTDTTRSPFVRGVIVRYLPLPEPNWQWTMTLVLSDEQELLDGTVSAGINVQTKINTLENAFRNQIPVHFIDVDGTEWVTGGYSGVLIYDIQKDLRYIGPSSDGSVEGDIRVTLIETVEAY